MNKILDDLEIKINKNFCKTKKHLNELKNSMKETKTEYDNLHKQISEAQMLLKKRF